MTPSDLLIIERWWDGQLNVQERAQLNARLREDQEFARSFAEEVRWQGLLGSVLSCPRQTEAQQAERGRALALRVQALIANATGSGSLRLVHAVNQRLQDNRTQPLQRIRAGRQPLARSRSTRPQHRRHQHPWWIASAMLVMLVALGLAWYGYAARIIPSVAPPTPAAAGSIVQPSVAAQGAVAVVKSLHGSVLVSLPGPGSRSMHAHEGESLVATQRIIVGDASAAVLSYTDGSEITISANSDLIVDDHNGAKRIHLNLGCMVGHIAKQPHDQSLVCDTRQARAVVVGTVFTLTASPVSTRLDVAAGTIAFSSRDSNSLPMMVQAGNAALVANGMVTESVPALAFSGHLWDDASAVMTAITPSPAENGWRQLPWFIDIQQARRAAQQRQQPLLVWLVWGSPLGMTATDSLQARAQALSDPAVQAALITRGVPVVVDAWYLRHRGDADGRFIAHAVGETQRVGRTKEGFLVIDAAGHLQGDLYASCSAHDLLQLLNAIPPDASVPVALPVVDAQPTAPIDALLVGITTRSLMHDASGYHASPTRDPTFAMASTDALWLSSREWHRLLPRDPVPGLIWQVPDPLVAKIAETALLDGTGGEAANWDQAALKHASLQVLIDSVDATDWTMRLAGSVLLDDGQRGYEAQLIGWMSYHLPTATFTRFQLLAYGDHWGRENKHDDQESGRAPLGILMQLDARPLARMIPPHAARDDGYFTQP